MRNLVPVLLAALCLAVVAQAAQSEEIQGKDTQGRDYWVYTPDQIDPDKTYTLLVGVHGYHGNGKGAAGYAGWVNDHDVIVLGPSYPNEGYQYLEKGSDQQTLDLIKQLRQQYNLHEKIFIAGFSGGAQYSHRFAMKHPDLVAGCAAHSAGTWGTGDYDEAKPNPKATGVLFVMSCGEKDTGKSFGDAPMGRLEWAKKYEQALEQGGYVYDAQWWPNVGHSQSKGARQMTQDCFVASTELLPTYEQEHAALADKMRKKDWAGAWEIVRQRRNDGSADKGGIIAKVHGLYLASLAKDIERIDRMAEREVQRVIRQTQDPAALRRSLESLRETYAGAERTTKAIDQGLSKAK